MTGIDNVKSRRSAIARGGPRSVSRKSGRAGTGRYQAQWPVPCNAASRRKIPSRYFIPRITGASPPKRCATGFGIRLDGGKAYIRGGDHGGSMIRFWGEIGHPWARNPEDAHREDGSTLREFPTFRGVAKQIMTFLEGVIVLTAQGFAPMPIQRRINRSKTRELF